jgi:hypothetical protein
VSNCGIREVEQLITFGANVDLVNDDRETPLHTALKQTRVPIIERLLVDACMLNIESSYGMTPLRVFMENFEMAKMDTAVKLIRCGCDANLLKFEWLSTQITSDEANLKMDVIDLVEFLANISDGLVKSDADRTRIIAFIDFIVKSGLKMDAKRDVAAIRASGLFGSDAQKCEAFVSRMQTPQPLMNLCRIRVRSQLKMPLLASIHRLNLPVYLKEFLFFA